jgi:hypothetical protein
MNKTRINSIRSLAALVVTVLLTSCMTPSQPTTPADPTATALLVATPTPAAEVQPLPTVKATEDPTAEPVQEENSDPQGSTPLPDAGWIQESFGDAWTIGYPAGWSVNAAGAHEGALQLEGEVGGHSYAVTFSYPIDILVQSLDEWVEEYLAPLTPEQRQAVVVSDLKVANTPAKKVLNYPAGGGAATAHHVYLWRSEGKNPRLITINQIDDQPLDAGAMEQLLDRLLAAVQ